LPEVKIIRGRPGKYTTRNFYGRPGVDLKNTDNKKTFKSVSGKEKIVK